MSNTVPTIGRIVHYCLTQQDVDHINKLRETGGLPNWGNAAKQGDVFPMLITRVWGDTPTSAVNGQVFLDGNDVLWATSVTVGRGPHSFSWPVVGPPKSDIHSLPAVAPLPTDKQENLA